MVLISRIMMTAAGSTLVFSISVAHTVNISGIAHPFLLRRKVRTEAEMAMRTIAAQIPTGYLITKKKNREVPAPQLS